MTPELAAKTIFVDVHDTLLIRDPKTGKRHEKLSYKTAGKILELMSSGYHFAICSAHMNEQVVAQLNMELQRHHFIDLVALKKFSKKDLENFVLGVLVDNKTPEQEGLNALIYFSSKDFIARTAQNIDKHVKRAWAKSGAAAPTL